MSKRFEEAMASLPLVAILRGIKPTEAPAALEALVAAGFWLIEIPLNSPEPLESIATMRRLAPPEIFVGAGTVLSVEEVAEVADAGGDLIVSPNMDAEVIRAAKARGLIALPGVATPTEAFAALKAGADGLKAFPAEMIPPNVVKAWARSHSALRPDPAGRRRHADDDGGLREGGGDGVRAGVGAVQGGDSAERLAVNARAFAEAWRGM